jgi:hypothetical protein
VLGLAARAVARELNLTKAEDALSYGGHELFEPIPADVEPQVLAGRDIPGRTRCRRPGEEGVGAHEVPSQLVVAL